MGNNSSRKLQITTSLETEQIQAHEHPVLWSEVEAAVVGGKGIRVDVPQLVPGPHKAQQVAPDIDALVRPVEQTGYSEVSENES